MTITPMNTILAAVDFSEVSRNAAIYACNLAAAKDWRVKLIHTYQMPINFMMDVPIANSGRRS